MKRELHTPLRFLHYSRFVEAMCAEKHDSQHFFILLKNESLYQSILLSLINEERSNRILIKMEPKELIIEHFFVSARPHAVNKWWQFQTSLLLNCETIVFTASQYGFAIFAPVPKSR